MYTRFILFGFVTSNGPSDPKSSCKSLAQCPPPPPHSLVQFTQEVAMVRERDVPDGRLTSSNGSVWLPSHDWHSIPTESLHPSVFSQRRTFRYLRYSSNVPSRTIFFSGFLTQKIFLAHFGLLVVLHIVIASLSHGRFVFLECFVFSLRLELGYLFPISLSVDGLHVHHPVHSRFRPHPVLSVLFQFFGLLVRGRETSTARYTLGPKHVIYEKGSWRRLHIHVVVTQSSPCCCGNKCD